MNEILLIILGAIIMFCYQGYKQKKRNENDYYKKYRRSKGWE